MGKFVEKFKKFKKSDKKSTKNDNLNINFKKNLGQNFLFDKNLLNAIADDGDVKSEDVVLEIGAGAGTLTSVLATKAKKVLSFEIDSELIPKLQEVANENSNIEFYFEDFMNVDLTEFLKDYNSIRVVANIPYYITTPIIFKLVKNMSKIKSILVLVQKEVAERFASKVSSKDYGVTSVILQSLFDVSIPRVVKKECFTPAPKIDSALCKMVPHHKFEIKNFESFSKFVQTSFSMRRKTLLNNLKKFYEVNDIKVSLKDLGLTDDVRPENLTVENFIVLYKKLKSI